MDSSVLFASDRGIMHIQGSQVSCLSEIIDTDYPFDALSNLPELRKIAKQYISMRPFKEYLESCHMSYDYTNQLIYISYKIENLGDKGMYPTLVFSIKSRMWGFVNLEDREIYMPLNSYPDALAVDFNNRVIDLAVPDTEQPHQGVYITRPITLDSPDILKTIRTVIQRGQFRRGNVQTILYASRDLINWFPVKSSVDHFLRGFSGSPWKYFRVVGLASLAPGESISSLSIEYQPKFTNRLR